jgi:outer membrane lipoprotein-sorting protein
MIAGMFFLSLAQDSPSAVLDRYASYINSAKQLTVEVRAKSAGGAFEGNGTLHVKRPHHMLFVMSTPQSKYTYAVTPSGGIEMETGLKQYSEQMAYPRLQPPRSSLSRTSELSFPEALLMDVREIYGSGMKFSSGGKGDVSGVETDVVMGALKSDMGNIDLKLYVAANGELRRVITESSSDAGTMNVDIELKGYRVNEPIPQEVFTPTIPTGFSANRLPIDPFPLQAGENFPDLSLNGQRGTTTLNSVRAGQRLFVAMLKDDCEPSKRAADALGSLAKSSNVKVVTILNAASGPRPQGVDSFVSSDQALTAVSAPGTPFFCLIDASGRISHAWFGFDEKRRKTFEAELRSAVQSLSATED